MGAWFSPSGGTDFAVSSSWASSLSPVGSLVGGSSCGSESGGMLFKTGGVL